MDAAAVVGDSGLPIGPAFEADLAAGRQTFVEALARRDAAAAAAEYSPDARLVMPSVGVVDGREAISAFWQAGLDTGLSRIEYEPTDLHASGAVAYELGRYAMHLIDADGGELIERGDYALVHERDSAGRWRRQLEMFSPGAKK